MHEMSIVDALLRVIRQEVAPCDRPRVRTVRVRVGQLRQVVPETLRFCFNAGATATPFAGAKLEVEQVPARARCQSCRHEFAVEERWFECPTCGAVGAKLLQGDELLLVGIHLAAIDKMSAVPA